MCCTTKNIKMGTNKKISFINSSIFYHAIGELQLKGIINTKLERINLTIERTHLNNLF